MTDRKIVQRDQARESLRRGSGTPGCRDVAKCIVENTERRIAWDNARKAAPANRDETPTWLSCITITAVFVLFFLGLRYLP